MSTIGYVLRSSNRDRTFLRVCDIGKADHWFLEEASCKPVSIFKRPQFLKARKALHKGDTFAVATLDVLSTNPRELLGALQSLKRKGVTVVLVRESFTLCTDLGKAYLAALKSVVKQEKLLQLIVQ
jgi:DNA invertase Pin-like site-specific DNA recombinase